jgi:hypothetical protein
MLTEVIAEQEPNLWSVFGIAAATASAVAAVVSVALVLWFRYRDRPAATWVIEPLNFLNSLKYREMWTRTGRGEPDEAIIVSNAGDGSAYRLRAKGSGCIVMFYVPDATDSRGFRTPATIARVQPTDSFGIFIWHNDITKRAGEHVQLSWLETPTRHMKVVSTDIDFPTELKVLQDAYERDHK